MGKNYMYACLGPDSQTKETYGLSNDHFIKLQCISILHDKLSNINSTEGYVTTNCETEHEITNKKTKRLHNKKRREYDEACLLRDQLSAQIMNEALIMPESIQLKVVGYGTCGPNYTAIVEFIDNNFTLLSYLDTMAKPEYDGHIYTKEGNNNTMKRNYQIIFNDKGKYKNSLPIGSILCFTDFHFEECNS